MSTSQIALSTITPLSRGRLSVHLKGKNLPAPAKHLLLRARDSGEECRVPLESGLSTAVIVDVTVDRGLGLSEGTWDAYIELKGKRTGEPVRISAGRVDVPVVFGPSEQLTRCRAYRTAQGNLSFSVKPLPAHVEVDRVTVEEDAIRVLLRRPPHASGTSATLLARERGGAAELRFPVQGGTDELVARVPFMALHTGGEPGTRWDLHVELPSGTARIGRHLDDIPRKQDVIVYPATSVDADGNCRKITPYYTGDNNLSIRVKEASSPAGVVSQGQRAEVGSPTGSSGAGAGTTTSAPAESTPRLPVGELVRRAVLRFLLVALARCRFSRRRRDPSRPVRILLQHAFGLGGTTRVVFDTAGRFAAAGHRVEIVSLTRHRDTSLFAVPRGVRLVTVDDRRKDRAVPGRGPRGAVVRWLKAQPSVLTVEADTWSTRENTLYTDVRLARLARGWHGGIVIGTRPSSNVFVGRLLGKDTLKVGQEHNSLEEHSHDVVETALREYTRLDLVTVLTRGDLRDYAASFPTGRPRIVHMPNALPELGGGRSPLERPVVLTAGRLVKAKGFDLLIDAFDRIAADHPDWQLRIYGTGTQHRRLQRMILERGLYERVLLMGRAERMGEEMEAASVFASSSRYEGFGMVIIEAMSKGLPVVSFDAPHGPRDILTPDEDGLLVPAGDVEGFAHALGRLMGDEDLRRRFADAGLGSVGRYAPEVIHARWEEALAEALEPAAGAPPVSPPPAPEPPVPGRSAVELGTGEVPSGSRTPVMAATGELP
jgi:glycosyltransferase involved in cell wall biosynthesis